jgi:hypothetical protein
MRRVYADPSLGIDKEAKFEVPANYRDCGFYDPTSQQRSETYNSYGGYGGEGNGDTSGIDQDIPESPMEEWGN